MRKYITREQVDRALKHLEEAATEGVIWEVERQQIRRKILWEYENQKPFTNQ